MNPNHVVDGLRELNSLLPSTVKVWAGGSAPVLRRRQIEQVLVLHGLTSISEAVDQWRHPQTKAKSKVAAGLHS
jgi:hypothetical protein